MTFLLQMTHVRQFTMEATTLNSMQQHRLTTTIQHNRWPFAVTMATRLVKTERSPDCSVTVRPLLRLGRSKSKPLVHVSVRVWQLLEVCIIYVPVRLDKISENDMTWAKIW